MLLSHLRPVARTEASSASRGKRGLAARVLVGAGLGKRLQRLCDRGHVWSRSWRFRLDRNCLLRDRVELTSFICLFCRITSFLRSRGTFPCLVCLFRRFPALFCSAVRLPCCSGLPSSGPMFRLRSSFLTSSAMLSCGCGFLCSSTTIYGLFHRWVSEDARSGRTMPHIGHAPPPFQVGTQEIR